MNIILKEMTDEDYIKASLFDFEDADIEFLSAFKEKKKSVCSIFSGDNLLGLTQIAKGKRSYIYVFIDAKYRLKGIAKKVIALAEEKIKHDQLIEIVSSYKKDDPIGKALVDKYHYSRKFSSIYMKYTGDLFDVKEEENIRRYMDSDYEAAHKMYALAFHKMRLSTGDFPDSILEEPSEKMREHWAKTSHERLVYLHEGEVLAYARVLGNEIASIAVRPENQGQGIGNKFMKSICNSILSQGHESVDLFCVSGNKAKKLYDTLAFKDVYTKVMVIKEFKS